jgi:hypothetical protein
MCPETHERTTALGQYESAGTKEKRRRMAALSKIS